MTVTLADVARAAGLSASTVSRALSAPEKVNADTAKRVRLLAEKMGYVATGATRVASSTRSGMIGLIVPDIANPFFPPIIKAVQARAVALGHTAVVADVDEYAADEVRRAEFLAERVEGLIVVSARSDDAALERISSILPLVLINRQHERISNVTIENAAGIREAVDHLVALGHRTISYLNGPKRSWSNTQRQAAVREACAAAGIELVEFGPFEPQIQAGARAADLIKASAATAVIAYDDLIALGVMARLTERGVLIGSEFSVVGIDDSPMSGMAHPSLTSIHVPGAQAGIQAVDLLLDLIDATHEGKTVESVQRATTIDTSLLVRSSTAPPPTSSKHD